MRSKSNLVHRFQIERPRSKGRAGAAERLAGALLRGGAPSEQAELALPGVKSTRAWGWGDLRGACSPPEAFASLGEGLSGESEGYGGSARRLSPASGVLSPGVDYRPSY